MVTILIVEDNTDIAVLYERVFFKYQTHMVDDAPTAISYLKEKVPDLVILDFHLKGSRGLDVLDYIRAQPALVKIPVLGISSNDALEGEAKIKGINAFMCKPLEMSQLFAVTRTLLPPTL